MCQPAWEAHEPARRFRRKSCQQQWGNEDFAEDKEAAGWWSSVWLTPHLVQHGDKGLHHACCACTPLRGFSTAEWKARSSLIDRVNAREVTEVQEKRSNPSAWFKVLEAFYSSFRVLCMVPTVPGMAKCTRLLHRSCPSSGPSPAPSDTAIPAEVTGLAGLKTTLNSLKFCSYRGIWAVQPSEWSVSFTRRASLKHVLWLQGCLNNSLLFFPFKMICRSPVELIFLIFGFSWRVNFCSQAAENQLFLHHA